MYCKPPSLKRVKIKRFTISIDLVSQTNKLKKHRIVGLFKTTTNKILDRIDGKMVTPFPSPPPRSPQIKDGEINQSFILTRYVKELKNSFKIRACINKKMARRCPSRWFILDLAEWGFAVPFYSIHCRSEFSLLKQVKEINACCFLCYATRHKKRYYCGKLHH